MLQMYMYSDLIEMIKNTIFIQENNLRVTEHAELKWLLVIAWISKRSSWNHIALSVWGQHAPVP